MGGLGSKQAELLETVIRHSSSFRLCILNMYGDLPLSCLSSCHHGNKFFFLHYCDPWMATEYVRCFATRTMYFANCCIVDGLFATYSLHAWQFL